MRAGAQHDGIDITRQSPRGIGERLTPAELHVQRIEYHGIPAELMHGDFEGDPGSGRGFLEDHGEHRVLLELQALRHAALALDRRGQVDNGAERLAV